MAVAVAVAVCTTVVAGDDDVDAESLIRAGRPTDQRRQTRARATDVVADDGVASALDHVQISAAGAPQELRDAATTTTDSSATAANRSTPASRTASRSDRREGDDGDAVAAAAAVVQGKLSRERSGGEDAVAAEAEGADDALDADAAADNLLAARRDRRQLRHRALAVARHVEDADEAVGPGDHVLVVRRARTWTETHPRTSTTTTTTTTTRTPQKRVRRDVRLRGPVYERVRREQPAGLETRSQRDGMRAGTADEERRRRIYLGACPCPCPFRHAHTNAQHV